MWLKIPTRIPTRTPTSHCSAATEDSTSPSHALCRRLAASVSWRGKLLRPQSWRLAWKTEGWRMRLSGLTLPPSQADSSVAAWLDSLVGSPAKTSASQGDRPESRESEADCSLRSSDSFASWSPLSGCFLRTSRQSSIFQREQPYLENLPKSGSMRNGELFERPMLVHRTGESGRLCWPTANVPNGGRTTNTSTLRADGSKRQVELAALVKMWTTPQAHDQSGGNANRIRRHGTMHGCANLADDVLHWPTPQARDTKSPDMEGSGNYERKMENGWTIDLNSAAANWPTLATRDYRSPNGASHMDRSTGAKHLDQLPNFIEHSFPPAPPTSTHGDKSPSASTRRLNPDFVDWLMGLPPGWTDYAPVETASYLSRVRSLLRSFLGGCAK